MARENRRREAREKRGNEAREANPPRTMEEVEEDIRKPER